MPENCKTRSSSSIARGNNDFLSDSENFPYSHTNCLLAYEYRLMSVIESAPVGRARHLARLVVALHRPNDDAAVALDDAKAVAERIQLALRLNFTGYAALTAVLVAKTSGPPPAPLERYRIQFPFVSYTTSDVLESGKAIPHELENLIDLVRRTRAHASLAERRAAVTTTTTTSKPHHLQQCQSTSNTSTCVSIAPTVASWPCSMTTACGGTRTTCGWLPMTMALAGGTRFRRRPRSAD
jgi:hypothetical protein